MDESIRSVSWEAPEHNHIEKTGDWYWMLGIVGVAGSVVSIILGNTLFGLVILLATVTMVVVSHRKPRVIGFEVSARGVRIDRDLYPYSTLDSFYLDEENLPGPQLIVKPKKLFLPLLLLPIPELYADEIEDVIASRLREEHLEEPFSHKLLEFFGF
jgi:hypothetical protein